MGLSFRWVFWVLFIAEFWGIPRGNPDLRVPKPEYCPEVSGTLNPRIFALMVFDYMKNFGKASLWVRGRMENFRGSFVGFSK